MTINKYVFILLASHTKRKLPRRCFDVFLGKNNYMKLQKENYQEDVLMF